LRLLAIDLETTGLDPATDSLLAIGFVPVEDGEIVLAGARRIVVAGAAEVGDSATIHGLTDDDIAAGTPLADALDETLAALDGRALLAHHALIETTFLARACRETGRQWPAPDVVDTMAAEAGHHERWGRPVPPGALRLWAARDRFGLPAYKAHDALMDAIGCAELHLAQIAERSRA
jgi:DNA polymerase-3 subunit epsilon